MKELTRNDRTEDVIEQLLNLWEHSVRATHHFLQEQDIQSLLPFVQQGLLGIDRLVVTTNDSGELTGFIGTENNKIEMLFIHPNYFRKGIGKQLTSHAIQQHGVKYVDVNEQNPQALRFYEHLGFSVFSRSELDDQGNPFPILHLHI